jgi:hypothetical protein
MSSVALDPSINVKEAEAKAMFKEYVDTVRQMKRVQVQLVYMFLGKQSPISVKVANVIFDKEDSEGRESFRGIFHLGVKVGPYLLHWTTDRLVRPEPMCWHEHSSNHCSILAVVDMCRVPLDEECLKAVSVSLRFMCLVNCIEVL